MTTPSLKELIEAKAHFGHRKALSRAEAKSFIFGIKNGINIINLEITQKKIFEALDFISKLAKAGKTIIFVGTKRQAQEILTETAKECKMPYINYRWLGGTLTNFETISKRIKYLNELEAKLNSDEAKNYTKKERTMWQKEIDRLSKFFGGIKNITKMPDALFIIDTAEENVAVSEARKMNIPIIGTGNTDANPQKIDYFIPMNDNSELAVKLICDLMVKVIKKGKADDKDLTDKSNTNPETK